MEGFILYLLAGLAGLIIQGSVLKVILPFNAVPNLVLILVVFLAFYRNRLDGPFFAFMLGLEYDLFGSHLLLGPNASAAVVVYFVVTSFSKRLFVESSFTFAMVVLVASFLNHAIASVITSQFIPTESLWSVLLRYSPFEAIVSAIVAPLVFKYLKKFLVRADQGRTHDQAWSK